MAASDVEPAAAEPAAATAGAAPVAPVAPPRRSLRQRLEAMIEQYGRIAIAVYLVLSITAIVGFSIAIGVGLEPSSATGVLGVIGAGWAAAKLTMPIRILITLAVTPGIAVLVNRRQRATAPVVAEPAE